MSGIVQVVVQTPAHSELPGPLSYRCERPLAPGTLVRVPLGSRETLGVVWRGPADPGGPEAHALRDVSAVLDTLPPLAPVWQQLVAFAARYYQRSLGEVALSALPPSLRTLDAVQLGRRLKRRVKAQAAATPVPPAPDTTINSIALNDQQTRTLATIHSKNGPFLLFGATGSGKTEVYLQAAQAVLQRDAQAQVLVMVPEINLTPQLEERFRERFEPAFGAQALVALHSGLTPAQRLQSWLSAHLGPGAGGARIVLGTRMAVLASLPGLRLIVVDEEHDPSYKQQEGARYSARDLAVYRAQLESREPGRAAGHCKVLLGSATPALESWHQSRPAAEGDAGGRYLRLHMPARIGDGALPAVRRVDMRLQPPRTVLAPALVDAIAQRVARGEQAMLLLNRRGYAPVLHCPDCGWKSECPHCSAYRVFHKLDRSLRCHHCGFAERVPRACPACGNQDLAPLGRGTERLEEHLAQRLAGVTRPDGAPARIARIDADSTRAKGALQSQLAQVHDGTVDVLVGTQMIAKGHDFRRITLVAATEPDGALFSADFRAPERLFALLMQAAGRAGRDPAHSGAGEMWVQTYHPEHPLFAALGRHDYPAFAAAQLRERQAAALPPFSHQALLRADARTQEGAQAFLNAAREAAAQHLAELGAAAQVTVFAAVPMGLQRVANVERAQMLMESPSRTGLQNYLAQWQPLLHALRRQDVGKGVLRWAIDVDPLAI